MQCLPVIQRELRVAARRRSTYRQRVLVGAIASAAIIAFTLFNPAVSSRSGRVLFQLVSWALFIFCLLEGVSETADGIAQERREGTLGLMFLTNLHAHDVIIGKLAASIIKSFTALLSAFPVILLPLWMGGVTANECARVLVMLCAALIFSLLSGTFISTFCKSAFAALVSAFIFILIVLLLPTGVSMTVSRTLHWTSGPLGMCLSALENGALSSIFWRAAIYSAILCLFLFFASGYILSKTWNSESISFHNHFLKKLVQPSTGLSESWGGESASNQPAVWLAEKNLPARRILWILLIACSLICFLTGAFLGSRGIFIAFILQFLLGCLMKLWIVALAVQPFHSARRNGALELLLCTPIPANAWVRGQMDALRGYFTGPGFFAAFAPVMFGSISSALFFPKSSGEGLIPGMMYGIIWLLLFQLDLNALGYMGLWFGLTESRIPRAVTKTIFRVMILPWLTLLIPLFGLLGMFIWPWAWMSWSSSRLRKGLQEQATRPLAAEEGSAF